MNDRAAFDRWLEWAKRDAEQLTDDDWHRLIDRCLDLDSAEMAAEIATLTDGELAWMRGTITAPADGETNTLLELIDAEIPRRVFGRRA